VTSFDFKELQIDFIHCKQEWYNYAANYYKFNDISNFVGKLARHIGLSHGHDGLHYILRDETGDQIAKILVSTDFYSTLKLLDLDVEKFYDGFDTMEEVFLFVQASKYFNPEAYFLENVSAVGRVRDRKRDSYKKFLEFNKSYTGPVATKVADKSIFLPMIFSAYPDLEVKIEDALKEYAYKKFVAQKFNGTLVAEITGLKDKALGVFIKHLRSLPQFSNVINSLRTKEQNGTTIRTEFESLYATI
jgi:hypothetical protein